MPSGSAMPWGNRDYDVNLVVADKAWDQTGQLWFNPFNTDGFIGDRLTVNWQWAPYLDVRARRYRFRILNGSVSRYLSIGAGAEVRRAADLRDARPEGLRRVVQAHPVPHGRQRRQPAWSTRCPSTARWTSTATATCRTTTRVLPTQGIAERYDIVVDFAKYGLKPGDKLFFVNTMEHDTGILAKRAIPLADILSGEVQAGADHRHRRHAAVGQGRPGGGQVHAAARARPTPASTRAWTRTSTSRPSRARPPASR
jgi:hypothetical protein